MKHIDVAIIGAGSAGLSARAEVAKVTDSYRVFDHGPLGTTCARVGCMPSKAIVHSANAFHRRHAFEALGISGADGLAVDSSAILREMRTLRDRFVEHVVGSMDSWRQDHLVEASARFDEERYLAVDGSLYKPKRTIIAAGTSPIVPQEWRDRFGDRIVDTDTFFDLETLPRSMAVIGLGPVGLELGQALSRLGVDVIGIDEAKGIGGLTDPALQALAIATLKEEFEIVIGKADLELGEHDRVRVKWDGGLREVDAVLAAVGRKPNLAKLGLENLGLELNHGGVPSYDRRTLRIDGSDLYLAGDVNGERPVLHEASDEGRMAGYNAARPEDHRFDRRVSTLITFCDPEIAVIGESHSELSNRHADFVTGEASFESQGRALVARDCGGCVRIYADRETGCLLGAEMFAPNAEHFAHMLAPSLEAKLSVHDVLLMPFYHPVHEEGVRTALRQAANRTGIEVNEVEAMRCAEVPTELTKEDTANG